MKLTRQSLIAASSLIIGGLIGASALIAFADNSWVGAPSQSGCGSIPCSNIAAPLNVGTTAQTKTGGSLQINGGFGIAGGPFVFNPGSAPAGYVLTASSSGDGTAVWSPAGATSVINSTGYVEWTEKETSNGPVYTCGNYTGDGTCTKSSPITYGGTTYYQISVACTHGNITDTISSIANTITNGGVGSAIVQHRGYCIAIK